MATLTAGNYRKISSGFQAGGVVINRHVWDVVAATNGDKVKIGQLPANHRIVPELCTLQVDASAPAQNVDVCVDADANPIFNNIAIAGGAYARTALSEFAACETHATSESNRDIYLLLNTAPATPGGKVIVTIASAPVDQ